VVTMGTSLSSFMPFGINEVLKVSCCRKMDTEYRQGQFLSRVSTGVLTRGVDIAILSVCPSVCPSVRLCVYLNG